MNSINRDLAKGDVLGEWTLLDRIGRGGNGQVWSAKNATGLIVAIKILNKLKKVAYQRFTDEVNVMTTCNVDGVVPILESYLPKWPTTERTWYVMPVGTTLTKHLESSEIEEVVRHFVNIASALVELHKVKITHRDIKPANIIVIAGKAYLGDFGLVTYPDKTDVTGKREELGPRWTMAPEIRRSVIQKDYRPADVYSLAKSLWIAITKIQEGFDGRYDSSAAISIQPYASEAFVGILEDILTRATEHEPSARPNMQELRDFLITWVESNSDFEIRNPQEWKYAQRKLFPIATPKHAKWHDALTIVSVLNTIGPKTNLNHLFFPTGGGLDLERATISKREVGCIELITDGLVSILKPKSLQFESFGIGEEWDYFRLECDLIQPSGLYKNAQTYKYEEVLDVGCGQYIDRQYWDYGEYQDMPLPEMAKPITRYFEGSFVIFQKTSTYNSIPQTYDGIHSKLDAIDFRLLIEQMIKASSQRTEQEVNF